MKFGRRKVERRKRSMGKGRRKGKEDLEVVYFMTEQERKSVERKEYEKEDFEKVNFIKALRKEGV